MADEFPNQLNGNPDVLERDGTTYQETARAIERATAAMRQLGSDMFRSAAVAALNSKQEDVAENITKAHARYNEAGAAIVDYARELRTAQEEAGRAIAMYYGANDQLQQLRYQLEDTQRLAQTPGPDQGMHIQELTRLMEEQQSVQRDAGMAAALHEQARNRKRAAAAAAIARIHRGNDFGDLNDGFWDSLGDLVDVFNVINKIAQVVLKIVSLVLTILAIVFTVASLFFPPLAAVGAALFGYAQLVNIAIAVLALLAFLLNGFHIMDLIVVGVAVLAAFGGSLVGKAIGEAAKTAVSTALAGISQAGAKAAGELAAQAATKGVEELTDVAVDGILDLGSDDARALFEDINPVAQNFLNEGLGDIAADFQKAGADVGGWVGADFAEGLQASGITGLAQGAGAFGEHLAAQGGLFLDQVGGGVRDAVQAGVGAVSGPMDSFATKLGDFFGNDPNSVQAQFQHDISKVMSGSDLAEKTGGAVADLGHDVLGGIPGGGVFSDFLGNQVSGLADRMHTASTGGTTSGSVHGTSDR